MQRVRRFLDLKFECPVCRESIVANEAGASGAANAILDAALTREVGPYDKFAHYRGALRCPGCTARLAVSFRDAIRGWPPRTELRGVRVLEADEPIFGE